MDTSSQHTPSSKQHQKALAHYVYYLVIALLAGFVLYYGWRRLWFLTDDALITFRYASNSQQGYGYTWNFPPFRPVEGYTNFLWLVLLDIAWRVTGIQPPQLANTLSLLFAFGTTAISMAMVLQMPLRPALDKVRPALLILVLAGILSNRTYITWTSSGLETAMFNFFVTSWVYLAFFVPNFSQRWCFGLNLAAVAGALTRPDGLLLVAASFFLSALAVFRSQRPLRLRQGFVFAPFFITLAHFVWRRSVYGAWLPNTYAAKYVAPWPESGVRYALSFVIEYSLWFWLGLLVAAVAYQGARWRRRAPAPALKLWLRSPAFLRWLVAGSVVGTLGAHFAYYTLMIGGDYFEYRVYSHLVPLILVSSLWLLNALRAKAWQSLVYLGLFVLCALPIPWTHWAHTRTLESREATYKMHVPVAEHFPAVARPYVRWFDTLQAWLIDHFVCIRHQEHKVFYQTQVRGYPGREVGARLRAAENMVMVSGAVGVPGWQMPTTNIIDRYGLNDYVVARNPIAPGVQRQMGHARHLPPGYAECFQPNVRAINDKKIVVARRTLTAQDIIACEARSWPPGVGETYGSGDLGIDHANAPDVDGYLWGVWPTEPLYLYFVPPDQPGASLSAQTLDAFPNYPGQGCVVLPPPARDSETPAYLFALLPEAGCFSPAQLARSFPWTQFLSAVASDSTSVYHVGYTAPMTHGLAAQPQVAHPASWANELDLLGYTLPRATYHPGDTLSLTLYYRLRDAAAPGQSAFVHLLSASPPDETEALWGQDDGAPCRDLYPMTMWPAGATVLSNMRIAIPPDIPAGTYVLVTGFYDWHTQEPVQLLGAETGQDRLSLTTLTIDGAE